MKANAIFSLAALPAALAAGGQNVSQSFYPEGLNTTSWIANDSIGVSGGVYRSGPLQSKDPAPYGSYNFCFEPHPRAQEYSLPGPVANGSVKAELVFLQYVQRHQRRTPYGVPPGGEYQAWNCSDVQPFLYAAPASGVAAQQPVRVYAATYTDPMNPFTQTLVAPPGTCQFPQLTIGGLLDAYQHGKDLWGVYGDKLGFLPRSGPDESTYFRSSESPVTQATAGGVLRGLWPWYERPVALHQEVSAVDTVNEGFSCPARDKLLDSMQSTPEWYQHLNTTATLLASLDWLTQNQSTWTAKLQGLGDNFGCWECNGYHIPHKANDSSVSVTQEQRDKVYRAADWEWNYWYRTSKDATRYVQLVEGQFIGELLRNFEAVRAGGTRTRYVHDFLHDNDVGPILGALGITALRWPGMGSNIAFELWRAGSEIYVRVLYSGQPVRTVHGILDWVPLDRLVAILKPFVPGDIIALCNG